MNKKGQFYLLAAVIIVSVLIGFATVGNKAETDNTNTKIYDLGKELEIETGNVYDYGIYQSQDLETLIEDWTEKYYQYSKINSDVENWIFVYGDQEEITAMTFSSENTEGVTLIIGDSPINVDVKKNIKGYKKITPGAQNNVEIKFKDVTHSFKLKNGENFFFIIKSKGYSAGGQ